MLDRESAMIHADQSYTTFISDLLHRNVSPKGRWLEQALRDLRFVWHRGKAPENQNGVTTRYDFGDIFWNRRHFCLGGDLGPFGGAVVD